MSYIFASSVYGVLFVPFIVSLSNYYSIYQSWLF